MSGSNSLAMIEKLSGRENYSTWRFAMKTYLEHEELYDCIEPEGKIDPKRDLKAKSKIILLVDSVNYVHIQDAKSAKEVWDNLANAFDDSGLTRRVGLLRDLCTTNLTGCSNVEEYVSKIMTTAHKLRNIGFKVDDEWLGTLLLSGLPETYRPMIIAIESSGMKISADSVKAKILQDVKMTESDTTAFAVNTKYKGFKKSIKKGPRCYICNIYGHISTECKSKPKKKNPGSSSYAAAFIASTSTDDHWYIDSGASQHMTKYNILQNEEVPLIQTVRVANDRSLSVRSAGKLSLDVCDDKGQYNKILFRNVLFVPDLGINLLSVSQIIKNGGQVKFNSKGCVIMNSNNVIVATATLINNMYRLNIKSEHAYISDVDKEDIYLWHQRMGHLNFQDLEKIVDNTVGVQLTKKDEKLTCITCLEGKQTRLPLKLSMSKSSNVLLELVHSDICGPMENSSLGGAKYFMTLIDDYSKKIFVYFLHKKSEAIEKFKEFRSQVEKQLECKIKCLRSDNGLEYVNSSFSECLKTAGIVHQTTTPYTPEQNGVAERMNRTLVEKAKCLLINANLPKHYWAEAIHTAAYLINRTPTRSLQYKTPEEMWSGQKPHVNHLKIFGCEAMIHRPKEKRRKWDPKAQKAIFIGYYDFTKGYRFLIPGSKTVIKSRDAIFLESTIKRNYVPVDLTVDSSMCGLSTEPIVKHPSDISLADDSSKLTNTITLDNSVTDNTSNSDYMPSEFENSSDFQTPPHSNITLRQRNKELFSKANQGKGYLCCNENVPLNYTEAIKSADFKNWISSIEKELESHHQNGTWILVEKPQNAKPIGSKWVFRIKDEPTGPRYKARLCAKGYAQKEGIDYDETFSPTVRYDSIRLLFSIAAQENLEIIQFDITTAFLHGELKENIFMTPPEGLDCKPNMDANPNSIPADPSVKLLKADDQSKKDYPYREAVGSLIHAATVSRPDIMFAVSQVSRYLHSYDDSHWNAVKKILKYLKETKDYGLCYKSNSESKVLIGYSDADFANDLLTRRSISGYVFLKNGAAVTWSSQRQQTVALSTTEAEFMAACAATKEAIWLKQLLSDISAFNQSTVCINIDNQSAINVIKNNEFHKRCKHIDIKYNFIKEKYNESVISLNYVHTNNQYADIFTKALPKDKFKFIRQSIGMLKL